MKTGDRQLIRFLSQANQENLEVSHVQEWVVNSLCQLLDSNGGALGLIREESLEITLKPNQKLNAAWRYPLGLKWQPTFFGEVIEKSTPLWINDKTEAKKIGWIIPEDNLQFQSIICLPLVWEEEKIGGVMIFNSSSGEFSETTKQTMDLIALTLSKSIFHLRQLQQLKIANANLEVNQWQLLRSRNILRALFDSIPTSMYIIDKKYNLIAVNMNRAKRIETPPSVLVGRRCYEALYQNLDVCADCRVIESLFGGKNTSRTKRQWLGDDTPLEWEISTYPIYDDANQVTQAILLEQDVTEKRRLETSLAQSEKLAAVGQLAAGLAHEINNRLTAIIANTQLLQREFKNDPDKLEMIDLIARAGARAAQVVRNLLDLARKEEYNFKPTDINETIRHAVALLQHEVVSRSVSLIFEAGENLPLVMGSQDHLQGVWVNLIANGIDSIDGPNSELRVTTQHHGNELRVIVADTGQGIPIERLNRIFEPFYTTKGPGKGTGLGLSLCHRIIKQHGGSIHVDSEIGQGTKFTVIFPINSPN